jgi:hypothetical protein
MAAGTTAVADLIVPEIFVPYSQLITTQKSRLIQSGALVRDPFLDEFLAGGGLTVHAPTMKDLEDDAENVSSDTGGNSSPNKIGTTQEIAVRCSRNNSWATADLAGTLAGKDPAEAIAQRVGAYWVRRQQAAFIALMKGVFANNAAAPIGTEHVLNDLTFDVKGAAFSNGVTNFTSEGFVDATLTMGDSMEELTMCFVHSIVYGRMIKLNLIDFVRDATNTTDIPTYLGRHVVVDDSMPIPAAGVFETWLFGRGAVRIGMGSPKVPVEVKRNPEANNGGGSEVLHNRVEFSLHPAGHAYIGTSPVGGPSNAATANNLAAATSWKRAFNERKMIKIARFVTREF